MDTGDTFVSQLPAVTNDDVVNKLKARGPSQIASQMVRSAELYVHLRRVKTRRSHLII